MPTLDWTNSVNDFHFLKVKVLLIALILFASVNIVLVYLISHPPFLPFFLLINHKLVFLFYSKYKVLCTPGILLKCWRPYLFRNCTKNFLQNVFYFIIFFFSHFIKIIFGELKRTFSFWLAMRGLYCGIPVCSYVFGPSWLLGTTIMIVLLLQRADSLHFTDCILVCCTCRRKRKDTSMEDVPHF